MNRIRNILNSFKKSEFNIIEKYIQFNSRSEKKTSLLHLIKNNGVVDETALSIHLYNKSTNNIKKLKERLLIDIEDVILMRLGKADSPNNYGKTEFEVIAALSLTYYYLQNGLLSEVCIKLRKIDKLLQKHESIFLEVIYRQLLCNYLERINDNNLENELNKLSDILQENIYLTELRLKRNFNFPTIKVPGQSLNYENGYRFYTACFEQLTQIKFLIERGETLNAEEKCEPLYQNLTHPTT